MRMKIVLITGAALALALLLWRWPLAGSPEAEGPVAAALAWAREQNQGSALLIRGYQGKVIGSRDEVATVALSFQAREGDGQPWESLAFWITLNRGGTGWQVDPYSVDMEPWPEETPERAGLAWLQGFLKTDPSSLRENWPRLRYLAYSHLRRGVESSPYLFRGWQAQVTGREGDQARVRVSYQVTPTEEEGWEEHRLEVLVLKEKNLWRAVRPLAY